MPVFAEFKKFAMRGSVVDLAIGVIIGASFTGIVNSLVNDVLMPPIGLALGGVDFSQFFLVIKGDPGLETLAAAKAAKARIAAGKAGKAKGAQTAAGKARAALSKTARAEAAAAKAAANEHARSLLPLLRAMRAEGVQSIGNLRVRNVHRDTWIAIEPPVADIAHDADDLAWGFRRQLLHRSLSDPDLVVQWIGLGPKPPRHGLINDDDRRRAAGIALSECAAANHGYAKDVEVAR